MKQFITGTDYYAEGFDVPITVFKKTDKNLFVYHKHLDATPNVRRVKIRINLLGNEFVKINDAVFLA